MLNNRFGKLGGYVGVKRSYTSTRKPETPGKKPFSFQAINIFELKKQMKSLNVNKPLGPSDIPAWVLKDCMNMIGHPLSYMINNFIS